MRTCLSTLNLALALSAGSPLAAQTRSPVQDLLAQARGRLNDLRFAEADSIVQVVLAYPQLRRLDRIQALQTSAGALYPEQESAQHRDQAIERLGQLVRIAPSAGLPREVTWQGLDELYRGVRQQTFGASGLVREKNSVTGASEAVEIEVAASRPASFTLWMKPVGGGTSIPLDSLMHSERGTLRARILSDGRVRVPSGNYELSVMAIDPSLPDTIVMRYDAVVEAPALDLIDVPMRFDQSTLLPEVTRPRRVGGIIGGLLVAAGTIAASSLLREDELKLGHKSDGRAVSLGIALGGITGGGVWLLDHGRTIPKNVAANRSAHEAFDQSVIAAKTVNEERIKAYHAQVTINPEVR